MIPLHAPSLETKDIIGFSGGDYKSRLQDHFLMSLKKDNSVLTSDGRNAIYLALKTIDLKPKDDILIAGYMCDIVGKVIKQICNPVYVDIDKETFNIDANEIEKNITKNTKAIFVAHLYGNPCDMKKIVDIAEDKDLILIEDVAQALNGKYDGKMLGSFGDLSIFSFRFTKDITSFRGGLLLANKDINIQNKYFKTDPVLKTSLDLYITLTAMNQIKKLSSNIYFPLKKHILFPFFKESASKFYINPKTLSNYQCYLLYNQLTKIDDIILKRRANARYYSKVLDDVVAVPKETKLAMHTYYRYTIQTDNRNKLHDHLLQNGIEADKMYDYHLANLTNSMTAGSKNMNIPVHHELRKEDLEKIVEVVYDFK